MSFELFIHFWTTLEHKSPQCKIITISMAYRQICFLLLLWRKRKRERERVRVSINYYISRSVGYERKARRGERVTQPNLFILSQIFWQQNVCEMIRWCHHIAANIWSWQQLGTRYKQTSDIFTITLFFLHSKMKYDSLLVCYCCAKIGFVC